MCRDIQLELTVRLSLDEKVLSTQKIGNVTDKVGHGVSIISLLNAHGSCYNQTLIKTTSASCSVQDTQGRGINLDITDEVFWLFGLQKTSYKGDKRL